MLFRLFSGELLPPEIHVKVTVSHWIVNCWALSFFVMILLKTHSCCNWGGSHESAIICWRMGNGDDYMGIDVTHTNPSRCLIVSITKNFFYFTNKFPPGRGHGRSYNCIWLFLFLLRKQSKLPFMHILMMLSWHVQPQQSTRPPQFDYKWFAKALQNKKQLQQRVQVWPRFGILVWMIHPSNFYHTWRAKKVDHTKMAIIHTEILKYWILLNVNNIEFQRWWQCAVIHIGGFKIHSLSTTSPLPLQ